VTKQTDAGHDGAPAAGSYVRPHSWALMLLLVFAAMAAMPDLFDVETLKRSVTALLAAVVILPLLAFAGREALSEWFTSTGARLLILVTGLSLVAAYLHLGEAAVTDRLLTFGLLNTAAVLGVLAARRDPGALGRAIGWAALLPALIAWGQALGWERGLTPGAQEIVALSGNSTRAGALLALGTLAWVVRLAWAEKLSAGMASARGKLELPPMVALALVSGALVLTRARGARMAAALALGVALIVIGVAALRAARGTQRPVLRPALLGLVAGIGLAALVGGSDSLMAHKLEGDGAILEGGDLTTNVRLALADSTADMVRASPWSGVGLGRFRAEFPPFRDAVEASLPGLAGAETEAHHPHNEFLLVAAEGGLPAALFLLLFAILTLVRAWRLAAHGEGPGVTALLVLLAGALLALVQDAWTDPATALPIFAAAGFAWAARDAERRNESALDPGGGSPAGVAITLATLLLALGLGLLAWPRLDAHLSLRSFYLRAEQAGGVIGPSSFAALLHAANVAPGDVDVQRMMLIYGTQYAPRAPDIDAKVAAIKAVERARERLALLAPHAD